MAAKSFAIGTMLAAVIALAGCQSAQHAHPAALTGDAGASEPESKSRATKVVSVRDTRGHVQHRVVSTDR